MNIEPLTVAPRSEVHPQAVQITEENIADVGAWLTCDVRTDPTGPYVHIDSDRRYSLASAGRPGMWAIMHPGFTRDIEILPDHKFERAYERGDHDLLDMVVSEEFPTAHAWAIVVSGPDGVNALPGRGIVDAAHLIGILELLSRTGGRPRS